MDENEGGAMTHFRADCPNNRFVIIPGVGSITEINTINEDFCDKCYCYICDRM